MPRERASHLNRVPTSCMLPACASSSHPPGPYCVEAIVGQGPSYLPYCVKILHISGLGGSKRHHDGLTPAALTTRY